MGVRIGGIAAVALVCAGLSGPALADTASGRAALQAGNFTQALQDLGAAARAGDPEAQNLYATMLKDGAGLNAPDAAAAVAWFRRAAEQGYAEAELNLGYMLFSGEGVPRDRETGVSWYRKAADAGLAGAQYNLARVYWDGDGVKRDPKQAQALFKSAAEQGLPEAQFGLGVAILAAPKGDPGQAFNWFLRAARQGEAPAYAKLAGLYLLGKGVDKDEAAAYMWALVGEAAGDPLAAQLRLKLENDLTPQQIGAAHDEAQGFSPVLERP